MSNIKPIKQESIYNVLPSRQFMGLLQELGRVKNSNILVIVEGKNDKVALNKFGITNVMTLNKPIYELCENINDQEVIILTDLDKEGKQLYSKIKEDSDQ